MIVRALLSRYRGSGSSRGWIWVTPCCSAATSKAPPGLHAVYLAGVHHGLIDGLVICSITCVRGNTDRGTRLGLSSVDRGRRGWVEVAVSAGSPLPDPPTLAKR